MVVSREGEINSLQRFPYGPLTQPSSCNLQSLLCRRWISLSVTCRIWLLFREHWNTVRSSVPMNKLCDKKQLPDILLLKTEHRKETGSKEMKNVTISWTYITQKCTLPITSSGSPPRARVATSREVSTMLDMTSLWVAKVIITVYSLMTWSEVL